MAAKKERITLTMSGAVLRKLDRAAKAVGRSRSAMAEELIEAALVEGDQLYRALSNDTVRRAFTEAMTTPGVAAAIAQSMGHELTDRERQQVLGFLRPAKE